MLTSSILIFVYWCEGVVVVAYHVLCSIIFLYYINSYYPAQLYIKSCFIDGLTNTSTSIKKYHHQVS